MPNFLTTDSYEDSLLSTLTVSEVRLCWFRFSWFTLLFLKLSDTESTLILFAVVPLIYMEITGERLVMNVFLIGVIAMGINSGAYVAEIFRAGIQSIDKGQMEASRALGLNWFQAMRFVIMPQAFKRIIPPLGNEFIAMLKDSSLVSVIGFEELTRTGQLIISRTYAAFEIWIVVALLYLIMTLAISRFVALLEKRFSKGTRK